MHHNARRWHHRLRAVAPQAPSNRWHPCKYSTDVVRRFLRTQFDEYAAGVRKADCHAELRRRLGKGPPVCPPTILTLTLTLTLTAHHSPLTAHRSPLTSHLSPSP